MADKKRPKEGSPHFAVMCAVPNCDMAMELAGDPVESAAAMMLHIMTEHDESALYDLVLFHMLKEMTEYHEFMARLN